MHPFDREEFRHFAGLYPHQVEGIAFLTRKGRAILGDDMGLGKTRPAIVAMNDQPQAGGARSASSIPTRRYEVIGAKDGASKGTPRWVVSEIRR